jgi:hypothetical protein
MYLIISNKLIFCENALPDLGTPDKWRRNIYVTDTYTEEAINLLLLWIVKYADLFDFKHYSFEVHLKKSRLIIIQSKTYLLAQKST